jgi:4-amino-4-deoxy-L-arabinose transferase-like glycosyltransferase
MDWGLLGTLMGLELLVKYSLILAFIPAGILIVQHHKQYPLKHLIERLIMAGLCCFAICGFWYGRNLLLYQELIPLAQLQRVISTILRNPPLTVSEVQERLPFKFYANWGVFVSIFMDQFFYALLSCLGHLWGLLTGQTRQYGKLVVVALL